MGRAQILVYGLIAILIGGTIAVSYTLYEQYSISSNKDAILSDLNSIASDAFVYAMRPSALGGGGGSYAGYQIPFNLHETANGKYSVDGITLIENHNREKAYLGILRLVGTSAKDFGTVTLTVNDSANTTSVSCTGKFE